MKALYETIKKEPTSFYGDGSEWARGVQFGQESMKDKILFLIETSLPHSALASSLEQQESHQQSAGHTADRKQ